MEDERAVNLIPTQSSNAYEAMTSRIGVPRFTRMTVISPVFLLWALTVIMPSSPDDGAAADGRLLVDVTEFVLLVTEFLLSFVGTLAGLKLSSDIAACIHTAQAFGAFSAKAGFKEDMYRLRPPPQRGRSAYCLAM